MPLTESAVKRLKPAEKDYTVCDYDCLYIKVCTTGRKKWQYRPRTAGAKKSTIGEWPDMSLVDARRRRDEIRSAFAGATNLHPFREVAHDWLKHRVIPVQVSSHVSRQISRLERLVYPAIGDKQLPDITPPMVLNLLREIEKRGHYATAHKVLNIIGQVFRYGITQRQAEHDITSELRGALVPRPDKHFPSIQKPSEIGGLLRAIDALSSVIVRCAMKFQAYTFVRPGELRLAEWSEIDLERAEWRIPAAKMKRRRPHIVPLSRQALAALEEVRPRTGEGPYIFASTRNPAVPMSNMTILAALRRMGYDQDEMTGHGFRSMASTNLNELGWPVDAIERQLAHVEGNSVRAAYNYAEYLDVRRRMMQAWADWLDEQRDKTSLN